MVEFNPEASAQLHPESGKTFGGVVISFEEWQQRELDLSLLKYSIDDVYHSEDEEYYSLNKSKTRYSGLPTNIVLLDTKSMLVPLYIQETTTVFAYRGREDFSKITRKDGENIKLSSVTTTFDGSQEVASSENELTDYELYNRDEPKPAGLLPMRRGQSILYIDGSTYTLSDLYWASDQFLIELLEVPELYLEKTI